MTLIKSTSGIRGTVGGRTGLGLTPPDIVKYTAAFGQWTIQKTGIPRVVIGRDARTSGEMVRSLVVGTMQALGIDVIDLGLCATPTVAMTVPLEKAGGGIVLSASHYPKEWNALKLLNQSGEVMTTHDGAEVGALAGSNAIDFCGTGRLGKVVVPTENYLDRHIEAVLRLPLVDREAISAANFRIAVDGVNSVGGLALPQLLHELGVETIHPLFCQPDGDFGHDPELVPDHLLELSSLVTDNRMDMGIAVGPGVSRLSIVGDDGLPFGNDYLLVAIADHVLKNNPGNIVGPPSTTLTDLAVGSGHACFAASSGEADLIQMMRSCHAVVGGDGVGGIIYPELHYGCDALVGIALFLSYAARTQVPLSQLKHRCPPYYKSKKEIWLGDANAGEKVFDVMRENYGLCRQINVEGLKIGFDQGWVHLRLADTDPLLLVYSDARSQKEADALAQRFQLEIEECLGQGKRRFKTLYN